MRLISLEANNVFSLGHVSLELADRKLLLVTGYSNDDKSGNGAGKSSLANHAIVWGLFGQTYDGTKGDSVINRNSNKKFGKVEITFIDINGLLCKITRTRNPNSLKLTEENLLKSPETLGRPSVSDTQEMINKRLGRDFSTFIHSDLIGPGTERSFFRLSGAEQVSVIENLLPINDLEEWTSVAKSRSKHTQGRILELKGKRNQLVGAQTALREYTLSIERNRLIWAAKNEVDRKSLNVALCNLKVQKSKLEKEADDLLAVVGPTWEADEGAFKEDAASLWKIKIELSKEIDFLKKIVNLSTCTVCTQTVDLTLREKARDNAASLQSTWDWNHDAHINVDTWLSNCEAIKVLQSKIIKCQDGIANLTQQAETLDKTDNPYQASDVAEKIIKLDAEIGDLDFELNKRITELRWFDFWANAYGKDLRTMMIEEICPFLEQRINEYLVRLGNPQFKATVSTVKALKSGDIREKFNLDIKSDHGANSFDLLSVGEKQIVSFAASLAVADLASTQVAGRSNVLILDEPFMGLHKNNCDNIINFLNQCDVETILLISNEEALKELVVNRVHVVKTKGQSWIE